MDKYELLKERMDNYCKVFESALERRQDVFIDNQKKFFSLANFCEGMELFGCHHIGIDKVKETELYGIFRTRAENLGLKISSAAIVYLGETCRLFQTPGDIVMYLGYLAWKAWSRPENREPPIQLTIEEIAKMLRHKALSPAKMDEVWLSQKGADCPTGNWLDMLSAETLEKIFRESKMPKKGSARPYVDAINALKRAFGRQ